jgi:uncharacterized protein (DUF1501 family)
MKLTRRDFIRHSCCTAAVFGAATSFSRLGLIQALAQGSPFRALVCIFLFGGNDSNNLVIPNDNSASTGYPNYFNIRNAAGLAIPQASLLPIASKTQQNGSTSFGLHPSMLELAALFTAGKLAFLANVGSLSTPVTRAQYLAPKPPVPVNLFSHSDQQEQWQSLQMNGLYQTGWAGRMADKIQPVFNPTSQFPPITSVAGSAIFNTGQQTSPYAIIPNSTPALQFFSDSTQSVAARQVAVNQLLTFNTGVSLIQSASSITSNSLTESSILSNALKSAPTLATPFPNPPTSIGNQLKQVAQILSVRSALGLNRQIFFCSLGGFDTHSGQITIQANLLTQLSQALNAFYNATVELAIAPQVTTFTMSDFSRTFQPGSQGGSGNAGTDHAWGSVQMILGGAVNGGDIYGKMAVPTLGSAGGPDDSGSNGRWIPTTSIDQYGATLATWFGVQAADLPAVFPNLANFTTKNLLFV